MIPRLSAIVTAWVRSLAPGLARLLLMCPFTVSSVTALSTDSGFVRVDGAGGQDADGPTPL
jgi:hypothetical protein